MIEIKWLLSGNYLNLAFHEGLTIRRLTQMVRELLHPLNAYDGFAFLGDDNNRLEPLTPVVDTKTYFLIIIPFHEVLREAWKEVVAVQDTPHVPGTLDHTFDNTIVFFENNFDPVVSDQLSDDEEDDENDIHDQMLEEMFAFKKLLLDMHPLAEMPTTPEDAFEGFLSFYRAYCDWS